MSTVTTQPAVKAALRASLAARPALVGVVVDYGEPGDASPREAVLISTALDSTTLEPLVLRRQRTEENYQLKVHVWSAKLETPAKTEARAEVIAEEIQADVDGSGTPPYGLTEVAWIRVGGVELVTSTGGEAPQTRLTLLIEVKARLLNP